MNLSWNWNSLQLKELKSYNKITAKDTENLVVFPGDSFVIIAALYTACSRNIS